MKKQYILPYTKVKVYSLERVGIMVDVSIPKGDDDGPSIGDGGDIQSKPHHFDVWEDN